MSTSATPGPAGPSSIGGSQRRTARAAAQSRIRWELLSQLIRKDLKVKYQGSTVGFAWSLANPLLMMAIYYVIFTQVFNNGVPNYAIYLMAGLLPFTAFSTGVSSAAGSVVGSAGLVKKVRFPTLVLPLASIGFALVQFALQLAVLLAVVLAVGHDLYDPALLLLIPALGLLVLFTTALGTLVAAVNVRWRDTSHFVEVAMLIWFWLNPILYPAGLVKGVLDAHGAYWAYFLNPMATVVSTVQRAIYSQPHYTHPVTGEQALVLADPGYVFYLQNLAIGFAVSTALLLIARRVFHRLQADFAEEL